MNLRFHIFFGIARFCFYDDGYASQHPERRFDFIYNTVPRFLLFNLYSFIKSSNSLVLILYDE